jgi:ABC-type phosphate/phosphonate transport system permease subunit
MGNSHYLEKDRLANLIAAIQIMGLADRPSGTLNRWIAELEASEELTAAQLDKSPIKFAERKKWQTVFEQHPEFFKTYTLRGEPRVLLRWRYAETLKSGTNSKNPSETEDNDDDEAELPPSKPLTADQIQVLINTAIGLHAKEAEAERNPDKFRPLLMAIIGAALGTLAGGIVVLLLSLLQSPQTHRLFD